MNEPAPLINAAKPFVDIDLSDTSFIKTTVVERKDSLSIKTRMYIAFAFLFQLFLAYTIMLIVMTYNFLLFLAPILGMVSGFIFIEITEKYFNRTHSENRAIKSK